MEFGFTEEQQSIRQLARDFAAKEVAHRVAEYDRAEDYPA
ncbi:MAG: acyl-CoA dehydrogenase family protein, partial [Chloroflexi bacterium]|nr:acyl-CoA dehydrogenase family protein [Chloroflexota bacterium]